MSDSVINPNNNFVDNPQLIYDLLIEVLIITYHNLTLCIIHVFCRLPAEQNIIPRYSVIF